MPERIGVGVDFGTTNSAAAIYDGTALRLVSLEASDPIMPSATYIDRDLQRETGMTAIEQYIEDNTGRKVELIPEVIGHATISVGGSDPTSRNPGEALSTAVYGDAMTDTGLQGRLFRGTKRMLGNKDVRRLLVFDHPFRLVALITPILLRIKASLDAELPSPYRGGGCLGHPVNFEGRDQHRNQLAHSRLGEAYKYAGFKDTRFYPEPIAAAVSFLHEHPHTPGDHLLTVDFGGGTLDLCVLRRQGEMAFEVVTTHGIGLGGDHIDQLVFRELLFPMLGKGERYKRRGEYGEIETAFPFEDYEDLLINWAVTYLLNQNKYTTPVQNCIDQGGPALQKFRRLRELIQQNHSYLVFQAIKDFKAELSMSEVAVLDIPEIDVEVELHRADFEAMIGPLLADFEGAVDTTLEKANLARSDIDIVLRTGGSSLIPAVHRLLDSRFPSRVVDHDPFTSVANGLAIADYHELPAG